MNDTISSLDISLLGDTIHTQEEGKTTQTELTLQSVIQAKL